MAIISVLTFTHAPTHITFKRKPAYNEFICISTRYPWRHDDQFTRETDDCAKNTHDFTEGSDEIEKRRIAVDAIILRVLKRTRECKTYI